MNSGISLRIKRLIEELFNGNKSNFARSLEISEASVRSYLQGTIPKADVLEKIAEKIAISCEWLLLGEGEMLRDSTVKPQCTDEGSADLRKIITLLEDKVRLLERDNMRLEQENESLKKELSAVAVARTANAGQQ